jgi:hypothetical protein
VRKSRRVGVIWSVSRTIHLSNVLANLHMQAPPHAATVNGGTSGGLDKPADLKRRQELGGLLMPI